MRPARDGREGEMAWDVGAGLEGRGVVVTDAAGGTGRAVARGFAQAGARVCAVDLGQDAVDALLSELDQPERHLAIGADLTRIADHDALLRRALDTFGRLDALAHLAGVIVRRADLDEVTEADWD